MKCLGAEIADEMQAVTGVVGEMDDVVRKFSPLDMVRHLIKHGMVADFSDDEFNDYMRDFGNMSRVNRLGNVDMHEYRLRIARNPKYTDRCRNAEAFCDCFDEDGNVL